MAEDQGSFLDKLRSLYEVAPVAILIVVVLGSMYAGIVTPTEAAALGSLVSLLLAAAMRTLTWRALRDAFNETIRTTSMVMLIIIFASMFSHVIALIGAPKALFALVVGLDLPRWAFFGAVFAFLLVIAYALEELSVMIILLPILFPLVTGLGFDPIWFGIIMIVWLEIGLITPPVGLNLFVIQNLMRGTTAADVTRGTTPYVVLMILLVVAAVRVPRARALAAAADDAGALTRRLRFPPRPTAPRRGRRGRTLPAPRERGRASRGSCGSGSRASRRTGRRCAAMSG